MAEFTMADLFEPTYVTLEEKGQAYRFKLRQRTKSIGEKIDALEEKRLGMPDGASEDDLAGLVIEHLDTILDPQGDGQENGTRKHAKTILGAAWKNDTMGVDELLGLLNFLTEKQMEAVDPTSRMTSAA